MNIDILGLFKRQDFTEKPPERQVLIVPVHGEIDKEYKQAQVQPVLAKAAEQIARSGLIWKWIRHDGSARLCYWDSAQKVFLQGSLDDWIRFFGRRWIIKDTTGQEYLGPSPVVADRLIQAILARPELPVATWNFQLQRRQGAEGK